MRGQGEATPELAQVGGGQVPIADQDPRGSMSQTQPFAYHLTPVLAIWHVALDGCDVTERSSSCAQRPASLPAPWVSSCHLGSLP